MTGAAWLQVAALIALVFTGTRLLGPYLARVYGDGPAPGDRVFGPVERLLYRLGGIDPKREQPWTLYALLAAGVQRRLRRRSLLPPAPAGRAAAEPDRRRRGPAHARVQHRRQLRHEHELAELRRRVDDEPPDADGGADGAELRLGRRRNRRRSRADPRADPPTQRHDRELLGRPRPHDDARAHAAVRRCRAAAREPGRRAVAARSRRGADGRGRRADDLPRAGREPGGDQGAGHERRRDRECQLRAPVREPDRLHEPRRDAGAAADPVRAHLRVRPPGGQPAAGLGDLRGDVHALARLGRGRDLLRGRREPAHRRGCGEHGGQGGALRRARLRALRRQHHRHVDGRGQRRPRQLHARRRRRAAREHDARRGLAGRRRRRALRDARLRPARGVHRRPDGRPDAGVPRARRSRRRR